MAPPRQPESRLDDLKVGRVIVEHVRPVVDHGRFAIKRTTGEPVEVFADIFADGHDVLAAVVRYRSVQGGRPQAWRETPMRPAAAGTDEWRATFTLDAMGRHEFSIAAWVDPFRTWQRDLLARSRARQDISLDLLEGALMIREAAHASPALLTYADALAEPGSPDIRLTAALDEGLAALMDARADRRHATVSPSFPVWVDRPRARFGTWYEMFPRSAGSDPARSGTFLDACSRLPEIADMGFDVLYLPPIHPIGVSFRKGRNNVLVPEPGDPGSPWAIGSSQGGHTAVHPALGTLADFLEFREAAERWDLEVALDLAWQCSPDHPWVREHPEWFRHRADGTIRYAENPPKKYQDIYPFDFTCEDWRGLWQALLTVTRFWIDQGVRIFRVDNPHTKTFNFWEWLIEEVHATNPEVIFLSEAFTRPAVMRYLAKAGFSQSYTYFTWRNSKEEITSYFTELNGEVREYFRPNLFTNTPDILHRYLQRGGRPAFQARLLLAATLGASYGIYSGFELCEREALPESEDYANSEKYQYLKRDWNRPGHIKELVARVNAIRRREPALQFDRSLTFRATDNANLIAYTKSAGALSDTLLIVVNLDPDHMQHGFVQAFDRPAYVVHDLLDDARYPWRGEWNYVRFDPGVRQGHILKLEP